MVEMWEEDTEWNPRAAAHTSGANNWNAREHATNSTDIGTQSKKTKKSHIIEPYH